MHAAFYAKIAIKIALIFTYYLTNMYNVTNNNLKINNTVYYYILFNLFLLATSFFNILEHIYMYTLHLANFSIGDNFIRLMNLKAEMH